MPLLLTTHWLLNNLRRRKSTQSEGEGQSVIPQTPLFSAVLTSHLGSAPSHAALGGSTSAPAIHDTLATDLEALSMSSVAGPSQPIPSRLSTSATGPTMVDDTFTVGHELLQFPLTSSSAAGSIHLTFDLSASTPTAEFAMVDNTLATTYKASEFLSTLSGPSQPIFDLGAGTSAAADELADKELTAELEALLSLSSPSGGTSQSMPSKNGSRRRRRAKASSRQMLTNKPIPNTSNDPTFASFSSGSDSQPSMVTFNPFLPEDRAIDVSDAPATGPYPFSFRFNGSASAGNVNAPQPSTLVPDTIGSTSNSFNDAGTSSVFGRATIGANKQAEAALSTQTSQPLSDFGMTGG